MKKPASTEKRSGEDRQWLEVLPAAVYTCDKEGRVLFYNKAAVELWGRTPEAGKDLWCGSWRIFNPDGSPLPLDECPMALTLREGKAVEGREIVIERPDGTRRHILPHPKPLHDAAGNITGAVNMLIDITHSKRIERELSENRDTMARQVVRLKRLHALSMHLAELNELRPSLQAILDTLIELHGAQFGFVSLYDPATDALYQTVSSGFPEKAQKSVEYLNPLKDIGARSAAFARKARVVVENTDVDPLFEKYREVAREIGFRAVHSTPIVARDGETMGVLTVHFAESCSPTEAEMQLADICARKAAVVLEAFRAQQEVRESEEQFRMLANTIPQMAWIADKHVSVTWYNQRWYEYTGTTFEEMHGWGWKKIQHPEHVDRVAAHAVHCFENEEVWEDTFPLRGADGEYRWFLSRATPIRDKEGHIVRWFGTNTDITVRLQAEEALQEADRRKDEFLAHMSHEIRTPLNAVTGLAHILALSHPLTPRQHECIETLQSSAHTLLDLINDLLDVSRLEGNSVELERVPFMLEDMMHEVISMMNVRAREKGIRLSLQFAPDLHRQFLGDPLRLRQIFTNLLSNAIKFTDKGSVEVALSGFPIDRPGRTGIRLDITDTGIGIEAEEIPAIFEKFSQANSSIRRRYGGTGLGLSITKSLVEMMGGSIEVTSEAGKGAIFSVRLTLEHCESSRHTAEVRAIGGFAATPSAALHVLLVEDYPANVLVTTSILENLGVGYETVDNGHEAVEAVKRRRFSMVLMDVQMPEMDGFAATRLIRRYEEEQGLPRTPIVGITAYALSGDRERCLAAGMDDYISKPFTEEQIQARIARHAAAARQPAVLQLAEGA